MIKFGRLLFLLASFQCLSGFTSSAGIPSKLERLPSTLPSVPRSESPWALDRVLAEGRLGSDLEAPSDAVLKRWQDFLKTSKERNVNVARSQLCENESSLEICALFSRPKKSSPREKRLAIPDPRQVAKWMKAHDFKALGEVPLFRLHGGLRRLKTDDVEKIGQNLLADSGCLGGTALPTGLGSKLEENFPDESHLKTAISLFERAARCGQDEPALQGQYRLGLIEVWQGRCERAIPAFERILQQGVDLESLQVRARYWMSHCAEKVASTNSNEKRKLQDEKWSRFPLSYHTLLSFNGDDEEPFRRVVARSEPVVKTRSDKGGAALTQVLEGVEFLLKNQEIGLARHLLSFVDPEDMAELEPQFRLYMATLYHRMEDGLATFRLLYRVINEDPQYQTLSVFRMYYPLWYFDEIKRHAGSQDPVLILSLVRQESAFNARAQSSAGARGLMQLMPRTARSLDRRATAQRLTDPELNLRIGSLYFDQLMRRFRGNVNLSLASYNAGAAQVGQWQKRYPTEDVLLLTDLMPFKETREYVAIIQRNYYWYSRLYPATAPGANPSPTEPEEKLLEGGSIMPNASSRVGELRSF